jgi:hypothetical protein
LGHSIIIGLQRRQCQLLAACPIASHFIPIRRGLHRGNQGFAGWSPFETAIIFGRNDDDFLAAVHGDMLWAFAADAPHRFAEAGLGVLQQPVTRLAGARRRRGFVGVGVRFSILVMLIRLRQSVIDLRVRSHAAKAAQITR